jgi:hypothetical protein
LAAIAKTKLKNNFIRRCFYLDLPIDENHRLNYKFAQSFLSVVGIIKIKSVKCVLKK